MKQVLKHICLICLAMVSLGSLSCGQVESPPVILSFIAPEEVPPAVDVSVVCVASSSDVKALTYEWIADNGTIKGEGNAVTWLSPESPGTYNLAVRVSDANDRAASRQLLVRVTPFKATEFTENPEILLQLPIPSEKLITYQVKVAPMTTSNIECIVSSNSTVAYKYTWTSNGGKLMGQGIKEGKASRVGWIPPGIMGSYTVTVEVTDGKENHAVGSVYLQVMKPEAVVGVDGGGGCGCGK